MDSKNIKDNKKFFKLKFFFSRQNTYTKTFFSSIRIFIIIFCISIFTQNAVFANHGFADDPFTSKNQAEAEQKTASNKRYSTFKIFGSNYEKIEILDSQLQGTVYYLVSGHGGIDPGATTKYNGKTLCEDEYAYDITLRLARTLISHGAKVYLITRDPNDGIRDGWYLAPDKDERCFPNKKTPTSQAERINQRIQIINKLFVQNQGKYQRMVEIHIDSRSKDNKTDVFFYYSSKDSSLGQKMAKTIRNTMSEKYAEHQPGRGYNGTVSERNLNMLRNTHPIAVFLELGNIQHERDIKRFIVVQNRQALAEWIAAGMIKDYKSNKK